MDKKMVMLGDSGVGKTSIVLRLNDHVFRQMTEPTIGSGVVNKVFETSHGDINLCIWDTAGEERYRSFTGLYSKGASACAIVFDLTNEGSFDSIEEWVEIFKENSEEDAKVFIVGNKNDLVDSREVNANKCYKWCTDRNYSYYEVSAKTGENVDFLFSEIAEELSTVEDTKEVEKKNVNLNQKQNQSSSLLGCC